MSEQGLNGITGINPTERRLNQNPHFRIAGMSAAMRRMIHEGEALRPNRQIINAVAAGEAGAVITPRQPAKCSTGNVGDSTLHCPGRLSWQRQMYPTPTRGSKGTTPLIQVLERRYVPLLGKSAGTGGMFPSRPHKKITFGDGQGRGQRSNSRCLKAVTSTRFTCRSH